MSKTLGNVVDPNEMLDKYPSDAFRYFCSKDVGPGADVKFSEAALVAAYNGELADTLGNLLHRGTALIRAKCYGRDLGRGGLVNTGEAVGVIAEASSGCARRRGVETPTQCERHHR